MLFAPGDQPRKVEKALAELPADAVILDLEDAVAISAKPASRLPVTEAIQRFHAQQTTRPRSKIPNPKSLWVRVNAVDTPWFFGDLDAVVLPGLHGIMLPKTPNAEAIYLADRYLSHLERERALPAGSIELLPLIESASGAVNLRAICEQGTPRLQRVGFGATDYTVDLGATWTDDESEILHVRSQMVLFSRAAGLQPPIDTVYPHFREHERFEALCRRSKALGFSGRMCIHPDQIESANRLYQPAADEVSWAQDVLAAFDQAESQGIAALQVRGQLVDYAFVARAKQILAQANLAQSSEKNVR
ncbi:MAG TPA: CoA ester lyase [Chloroflexota bacterium]|nr:CoA ester lyase [Chloroflexota bacterium]